MLPIKINRWLLVLLLSAIIITVASPFVLSKFVNIPSTPTKIPENRAFPTNIILNSTYNNKIKVIYDAKNDTSGRSVLYDAAINSDYIFPGHGFVNSFSIPKRPNYFAGILQAWENIPNSADRYMIIEDPVSNEGKTFKVRLVMDWSVMQSTDSAASDFHVENLLQINIDGEGFHPPKNDIKPAGWYGPNVMEQIVQPGDAVAVRIMYWTPRGNDYSHPQVDENQVTKAAWLVIRRENGVADFNQELSLVNSKTK